MSHLMDKVVRGRLLNAVEEKSNSTAEGRYNVVLGRNCRVVGNNNIVLGDNNNITGDNNIVCASNMKMKGSANKLMGSLAQQAKLPDAVSMQTFLRTYREE